MDWQTIMAVACVLVAAVVVGYRMVAAARGLVSSQSDALTNCGACSGCSVKRNHSPINIEPEIVLLTVKPAVPVKHGVHGDLKV